MKKTGIDNFNVTPLIDDELKPQYGTSENVYENPDEVSRLVVVKNYYVH